jgi:hypothetical protein
LGTGEAPLYPIETEEPEEEVTSSIAPQPSIVDLLRQDLKELEEAEDVFIPIIGYERVGLQVKYRMPESGKQLDEIARRVMREHKDTYSRNLYTAIDTMITLCEGLYVQPQLEVELEQTAPDVPVMLDPELSGEPVKFDERLAEALGFGSEVHTARAVLRRTFGNNDLAVIAHAEKLSRWLSNTKANLDMEFWQLGEAR